MSLSFQDLGPTDETTALHTRVARLKSSLEWASEAIEPSVREDVMATIGRCEHRLALGVDHTVVALAGGTGSGKSSLFNALTGTQFAVPGVARPTTSEVSAATWGDSASALLDWIGVEAPRRLGLIGNPKLRGVVLLDLPDHDSVNASNRAIVDRVVPMADLLVWVMDPQKYADNAVHSAYLSVASDHGQPSLVVLNHVDRLETDAAWEIVRDLQRLLAEDGLDDVPVMPLSARTGQGVDTLLAELEGAAEARSVAAEAVRADLVAAGRSLSRALARDADPQLPDIEELVSALATAAGIEALADASAAVALGRTKAVPALLGIRTEAVERERLDWVDEATHELPVAWHRVVNEAVAPAALLAEEINAALEAVEWPTIPRGSGVKGALTKHTRASAAAKSVRSKGRAAVRSVLQPLVVEPTELIHQAYRNLDELTELARD
ncbi:GTP-binding protein [Demequina sp.]|uniref:GTP-binding protein n=1 Tax=Demequina sp. TaxID=2050685 RepID=UPI003D1000CA